MLKRKKRMRYEPPGSRSKGRKRSAPRRVDQIFLTRRVFIVKTAVVAGFATLAARLAQMQIVRGDHYVEAAKDNVVSWKATKPIRGLIMDRRARPLAGNRRTWEVRFVPTTLRQASQEDQQRVRDLLITALRLPDCLIIDPKAVPADPQDKIKTTVYTRVANLLGDIDPADVEARIKFINASAKYNYVVLVEPELTSDQAARFNEALSELPGVEVVNYFDYLTRNYRYWETPVSIKRDVSRDVALKLEANRLYLPSIELDDNVLTRQYYGGPVMSHVLGYVGKIQDGDLNDDSNIARRDETRVYYKTYQPDDYIGQTGIERKLESVLRGQNGGVYLEQDASGVEIREVSGEAPAVPGKNLKLTIDLELQSAVSKILEDGIAYSTSPPGKLKPSNTRGGAVVMMSPRTGEIFSMVTFPNYDNQLFIDGLSVSKAREYGLGLTPEEQAKQKADLDAGLVKGVTDPLTDRAAAGSYAPGSTLKLFMATSALREKKITEDTRFFCTGAMRVPYDWDETKGNYYYCWIRPLSGQHESVNVIDALERSCDIFFYNVGMPRQKPEGASEPTHYFDVNSAGASGDKHYFEGLGIELIFKNLTKRFWFGTETGIDLPLEAAGRVPNPAWRLQAYPNGTWSSGDTINTSIGQGDFESSPLQIAVNTAALANGGKFLRPRLVYSVVDDKGEDLQKFEAERLRSVKFDPDHLAIVREGMRRVVHSENGTAHHNPDPETGEQVTKWPLTNPPGEEEIIIAGKTGTAEIGVQNDDGTYSESHAWFTCYAPFDKPEVVLTVFLERGGEGATYAVPIADKALRAYFEWSGKRPRGTVLREDEQPINDRTPAPNGVPGSTAPPAATSEA
jgi:penicillin-binding protein 2